MAARGRSHDAIVLGGGLAGMTAAKELAERGQRVLLLEAKPDLGGKAGSPWSPEDERSAGSAAPDPWGRVRLDHGFHAFPGWYRNTRKLMREIGCAGNLVDFDRFHFLDQAQRRHTVYEPSSLGSLLHDVLSGPLGWAETLLSYYFVLDLAAESLSEETLDRVSATGLLRSRFYATERMADFQHQNVLQAAAVPYHEVSALTLQNMFRAWMRTPSPVYSILNGSLHDKLIAPFAAHLARKGVEVRTGCEVTRLFLRDRGVERIEVRDVASGRRDSIGDADACYVLAVPRDVVPRLDWRWEPPAGTAADDVQHLPLIAAASSALSGLAELESAPMSAVHVLYGEKRDFGLPPQHVGLLGSSYGITLVDLTQHWEGLPGSLLSIVAAKTSDFRYVAEKHLGLMVVEEVARYIPAAKVGAGDRVDVQAHFDEPLFLNTVGAWARRPTADAVAADGVLPNLFLAGDYCRTDADLATMESAVMSGVAAAGAVLRARSAGASSLDPLPLERVPFPWLRAARLAALPLIAPIGAWKWLEGRLAEWSGEE